MKLTQIFLLMAVLAMAINAQTTADSPGCALIEKSRDSLFVSFERVDKDPSCKNCEQVIVRLQNNSTCPILIRTAEDGAFFEPLPNNATSLERIKRKPLDVLPNDVFVPEVCYSVQEPGSAMYGNEGETCGGDVRYEFKILGGRSIQFAISRKSIRKNRSIYLGYQFAWEAPADWPRMIHSGDVEHRVFIFIPENVYRSMAGQ